MKQMLKYMLLIITIFVGLGSYTSIVLSPIVKEAIATETHKVENNINNEINNKFKKIESLTSNLPVTNTAKGELNIKRTISNDSIMIHKKHLTRRQRKRLLID